MNTSPVRTRFGLMAITAIAIVGTGGSALAADASISSGIKNGLFIAGLMIAFVVLRRVMNWIMGGRHLSWIEPKDLAPQLGKGFKTAIVDVRSPAEFSGDLGHIAGSVNIPLNTVGQNLSRLKQMSENGIIAVCRSDSRAAMAASMLRKAGIENVTVLKGGMMRWNALGLRNQR